VKVRYTETALIEVDELLAYIAERSRTAADAVRARIEQINRRACGVSHARSVN
jgi:hypothetical protein